MTGWHATHRSCGTASPRCRRSPTTTRSSSTGPRDTSSIDVDGNHYLDAISSLWVTTLGHHVPELDDAIIRQLAHGAHSTMLGNGNRVVVELSEALARVVPVDDPHFLYASDGASAVEQALKIAFQYWRNRGIRARRPSSRSAGRTTATRSARCRSATTASGPTSSMRCASRSCARPRSTTRTASTPRPRLIAEHASELAAVIVEPSVQAAAGMQMADHAGLARLGAACRAHDVLLICDEIATGFGRTGRSSRRSSATCGPTCSAWARGSPRATSRCR